MTVAPSPLVLTRSDIQSLMTPADYLDAVEQGFRALHSGEAHAPPPWHIPGTGGGFHGKGASLRLDRLFMALKLNGNFPGNPSARDLPSIQGVILLCDGETGSPLAIMDSIEVTLRRTAAATALAARHLARPESSTLLICGCGEQATAQLEALRGVLPIRRILAFDRNPDRARLLAGAVPVDSLDAALEADVIVTCTPATEPFLSAASVSPGTFVAAVGADAPHKGEICLDLMAGALMVADSAEQCAVMGDLHHAIEAGALQVGDLHAELAEVVAGARQGRTDDRQITLFDSTGVAVQDVASAVRIYERALAAGSGTRIALAA